MIRGWRFAEGSFVAGRAERGTCPPLFTAFIATPKFGGFPRAPTPRWRLATRSFDLAMSYTRAPKANLCAEIIARAPPNKRSAVWGAVRSAATNGGHVPRSAKPATKLPYAKLTAKSKAPLRETPTSSRSVSFPPISSAAPKWGGENAPSHLRHGTLAQSQCIGSQRQARFGGACHARCDSFQHPPRGMRVGDKKARGAPAVAGAPRAVIGSDCKARFSARRGRRGVRSGEACSSCGCR